ncbi:MAG TPA: GNAT family N-acetyltransferase [Rhodothermales bacterium]|nr:GNAT family N-acetyltransferase [Rhodothermales bacterium]
MSANTEPGREAQQIEHLEVREGLEGLTPARIVTLYRRAPLFRPVDNPTHLWQMFERSSLVLTAWNDGNLVGVARVLTDGVLYSYLCDLAVEPDVQRLGVGKALIDEVLKRCRGTDLVLRDSDISTGFYAHLGFQRVENAWVGKAR